MISVLNLLTVFRFLPLFFFVPRGLCQLNHSDIPADDYTRTTEGWEQQFWGRIKGVFGWTYDIKS